MLRTVEAAAGVVDVKDTEGSGGSGHEMLVFLLAAAAATLVLVEMPQGLCTHRVTGFVSTKCCYCCFCLSGDRNRRHLISREMADYS